MTTEINHKTAIEWLENHFANIPGIWEQFDLEDAANSLEDAMTDYSTEMCGDKPAVFGHDAGWATYCENCGHGWETMNHWWRGNYDDLPVLDLMCIIADAKI